MLFHSTSEKQYFNYKLLVLFLSFSTIILLNSFFDPNGYLSPDSTYYLRLSKNLLLNKGFSITNYMYPDGKSFFAIWPVGYPVLIYIVSKLTGLGIVWASKAVNLLIIGCILLLFRYIFRRNAHWAGLIFFMHAIILIFSFTWSEAPFILFLLCISITLYKCVETGGRILWLTGLFFSGIALFLMRYIGLISVGIIGLIALINLFNRRWLLSLKLFSVAFLQVVFAGLYLFKNKISTGYITGMPRALPEESNLELLKQLLSSLKEEIMFIRFRMPWLVILGLILILGIYLYIARKKKYSETKFPGLWKYFLLTGVLYLAAIIGSRWVSNIEPLYFRFLAPGTFLLMLSLFSYLQGKPRLRYMKFPILYLIILAILSIHYFPQKYNIYKTLTTGTSYFKDPNYIKNTRDIMEKYKEVEPMSVVIFGSIHLRYLREDIIPTDIYGKSSMEDMLDYFTRNKGWNVYMNISDDLDSENYHESFIRYMEENKDKQLVKLRSRE